MQQDILINWSPQETRVAVVEQGAVQELHVERTLERGLVGNIYLGKVARVLPGMQSAFIDIGLERAAFLHVADLWQRPLEGEPARAPQRRRPAPDRKAGVRRPDADGAGHQGPHRHQGRAPVHADQHRRAHAGVPAAGRPHRHLAEDPGRPARRLRERVQQLARRRPEGKTGGFILRTNAEDASDAELAEDIAYLRKTWARIREAATRQPPASLLHQDLRLLQRVLRDLVGEGTQSIRIDSREQFER
jgi:ribonuclease G